MRASDLSAHLEFASIDPNAWAVNDACANECYVILNEGSAWAVFYAERGIRTGEKSFRSESEACKYFFELITSDPSTKKRGA